MKVLRGPIWVLSAPDGPWVHGDVMTLTYFPHYWPLVRTGHRWILLTKWPVMQNDVLFFVDLNKLLNTWASYQIRKIACCACAGNAGNAFPRRRLQRKLLVSDPGMHHGTCVTHVPWCMSVSPIRGGGENVPGIPGACASASLRIW